MDVLVVCTKSSKGSHDHPVLELGVADGDRLKEFRDSDRHTDDERELRMRDGASSEVKGEILCRR